MCISLPEIWGVLLILELMFEFLAGKMLNSRNAFSIVESFKDEFVLAYDEIEWCYVTIKRTSLKYNRFKLNNHHRK